MQNIIYDLFHDPSMQARLAGGNHAMRQDGTCCTFYIIGNNVETPMYGCICLRCAVEGESTSWADAQLDPTVVAGRSYQFDNVTFNGRFDAHSADHPL